MADPRKELIVNFVRDRIGLSGAAEFINGLRDDIIIDWVPRFKFSSFHKDNAFLQALESVNPKVDNSTRNLAFYALYTSYVDDKDFTSEYIGRNNKIIDIPELYKLGESSQLWSEKIKLIDKVIKADIIDKPEGDAWENFVRRVEANQPEFLISTRNTDREEAESTIPTNKFLKYIENISGDSVSKEDLLKIIKKLK